MAMKRVVKRISTANNFSLGEAFKGFILEKRGRNVAQATIRNYEQSYEFFMNFHNLEESDSLGEVNSSMFYEWAESLKEKGVRPSSINHYLRDCRTFFYWCMNEERQYMKPFKIHEVKKQEESIKLFSDEEIAALLKKPDKKDSFNTWRTYTIVCWVLATGNRAATVVNIKIGDIDFKNKEIKLRHTKNKKTQIVPLSSSLETALRDYMRLWRAGVNSNKWLFCNVGEEQLTTNALRLSFRRYCKERNVEHTNIHGLRHSFAKGWVLNNGNMFALQKILGHSTLDMTRRYVRLFNEDIKLDYDNFSVLDNFKKSTSRTHLIKRS